MKDELLGAVLEASTLLRTLAREETRPDEALSHVRTLQAAHPALGVDLLWEEETYDASVHYDVLLSQAGEGTVSLSYCADRGVPWPMRGVHRWREGDLVRVNETTLTVERAVANLDIIWDEAPLVQRLIDACLVDQELSRNPIELSDEELQRALDAFRRAHRLHRAEDTHRWLERRGMTVEALERLVTSEALVVKLRQRVAAGRVEAYFEQHQDEFDTARIARFEVGDAADAIRIATSIQESRLDFYAAAECQALAADDRAFGGAVFALVRRAEAAPELASAVFAAGPGDVVGPVPTAGGFIIVRVLDRTSARLDGPTRLVVERRLFDDWLEARRREARIEWFWGNAAQTNPAA